MRRLLTIGLVIMASLTSFAQKGIQMEVWPNGAPNSNGNEDDKAEMTVYLPKVQKATGKAVVCCPGGSYSHVAIDHEGHQWATFFNNQGIAFVVLKYRMPNGTPSVPVADAEEAIRTIRRNAHKWNVDTAKVGIMGFSAGGHLASTIATHAKGDAAPNFQILFYPVITMQQGLTHQRSHDNLLGTNHEGTALQAMEEKYSNERQVTGQTPSVFIALSSDDKTVPALHGLEYYEQLYRHGVPASIHIYPSGGHGWGFLEKFAYHYQMLYELKAWIANL